MEDIISEVLLAEKRVEEILQKARSEASDLKLRTEKEVSQKIAGTRDKAREIIQNSIEKAQLESENLRNERIKEADLETAEIISKNRTGIEKLVQDVVKLIIQTDYEEETL